MHDCMQILKGYLIFLVVCFNIKWAKLNFFINFHEKIKFPNFIKDHFYDVLGCPGHQKTFFLASGNHYKHQKIINAKNSEENDEI